MRFLYGLKRWVQNLDNRMGENIPLYDPFKFDDETTNAPIEFFIEFITNNLRYNYQLNSAAGRCCLKASVISKRKNCFFV